MFALVTESAPAVAREMFALVTRALWARCSSMALLLTYSAGVVFIRLGVLVRLWVSPLRFEGLCALDSSCCISANPVMSLFHESYHQRPRNDWPLPFRDHDVVRNQRRSFEYIVPFCAEIRVHALQSVPDSVLHLGFQSRHFEEAAYLHNTFQGLCFIHQPLLN